MHGSVESAHRDPAYRSALLTGAILNAIMFFVEGGVGLWIGSAALIADAVDFLEDAGMYALAVLAVAWAARTRAKAALAMAAAMGAVGLVALWQVAERLIEGGAPEAWPMAATASLALLVNVYCAWRLVPFKRGDAGMRSVWLSTRNDVATNAVVIVAAVLVALTASGWPDVAAGAIIAAVNLAGAFEVFRRARGELRSG
jgi:Co/Zn/Cd efflux system component